MIENLDDWETMFSLTKNYHSVANWTGDCFIHLEYFKIISLVNF